MTGIRHSTLPQEPLASPMRQHYIQMRKDANTSYKFARIATMGLAFNHRLIHTRLCTHQAGKQNLSHRSASRPAHYTALKDGRVQPSWVWSGLSK